MQKVSPLNAVTQRTILFLIADTGAGHRSAANAISNAIKLISQREQEAWQTAHSSTVQADAALPPPTYRIEIVDVFEEYSHFPLREAVKLYGPTIRYNPKLYGEIFHKSNSEGTVLAANALTTPLIFNGLLRLFTTVQPDIIVSVHPIINYVTIKALHKLGLKIPFITVVTDLISVHFTWFAPGADDYIVPTEQAKDLYLQRDLDPKRVHVLGMPIDPKFAQAVESKDVLRHKFNLKPSLPVILLVGGGDGAGGLQTAVRSISQAHLPVQLLVVTGHNKRLYAHLQRSRSSYHVPMTIFGFVQNMPELMHAADVIVTKAGPGTIFEALACHLPIVLSGYIPGQEEGNVDFVVKNDVGALALDPTSLIDELRRLVMPGSVELRRKRENAERLARPRAAFSIAEHLLSHLAAPEAASIWRSARSRYVMQKMSGRLQSAIRIRRLRNRLPGKLLKSPIARRISQLGLRTRDISKHRSSD